MSRIWTDVLQIQSQDPEANFFDLGGTSVMAPMLRERIQKKLGVDIGVTGVFLHPCLRELEEAVRNRLAPPGDRPESAARPRIGDYLPDPEQENGKARRGARQRRFSRQASLS